MLGRLLLSLLQSLVPRRIDAVEIVVTNILTVRYQQGFAAMPDRLTYAGQGCGKIQLLRQFTGWTLSDEVDGNEVRCAWRTLRACCGAPTKLLLYESLQRGSYQKIELVASLCVNAVRASEKS